MGKKKRMRKRILRRRKIERGNRRRMKKRKGSRTGRITSQEQLLYVFAQNIKKKKKIEQWELPVCEQANMAEELKRKEAIMHQ